MSTALQDEIAQKLSAIRELSPDVRFGQLLATLGYLSDDMFGKTLWDVEDEQFLQVMERHLADLISRQSDSVP
jgi:hypothetical protein